MNGAKRHLSPHSPDEFAKSLWGRGVLGHQVLVPVTDGKLDLGPWERVHYGEFDGRRNKRVLLKALGL
jgi:thiamine phosphate synthase YjbQ (UPF0047 family)